MLSSVRRYFGFGDMQVPALLVEQGTGVQPSPLPCFGCAHSAATAPWPGKPSGERPCCFCTRNPDRELWLHQHVTEGDCSGAGCKHPVHGYWYDGSKAVKTPADNYHSLDYSNQVRAWDGTR